MGDSKQKVDNGRKLNELYEVENEGQLGERWQ